MTLVPPASATEHVTKASVHGLHVAIRSAAHAARTDVLRDAAVTVDCLRKLHPPAPGRPGVGGVAGGDAGKDVGGWSLEVRDRVGVGPVEAALAYQVLESSLFLNLFDQLV